MTTTSYAISEEFRALRFDPKHHLGLGDIRLTVGQQEDLVARVQELEGALYAMEGALQEVRSFLPQVTATHKRVDGVLGWRCP